jgi:outer membrane receptor for ferrienterochelin and colicin
MKNLYLLFVAGVCTVLFSCNSYQGTLQAGKPDRSMVSKDNVPATMAELMRRQPNIQVSGSDQNLSIKIRGNRSFTTTNEPLFIVNGRRMGHAFASIANINPMDVERITIIRDPAELSGYGVGASNGVIEISLNSL